MNPYSGEIEHFGGSPEKRVPDGWLVLTDEEVREFERLPRDLRLERYMKNHFREKCAECGCFIGNHSLRKFKECAASELARIELRRLETQMNPEKEIA